MMVLYDHIGVCRKIGKEKKKKKKTIGTTMFDHGKDSYFLLFELKPQGYKNKPQKRERKNV